MQLKSTLWAYPPLLFGHHIFLAVKNTSFSFLQRMKVDRELKDAIAKHGEVVIPESFEDQLAEKIEIAKKRVAAQH